MESASVTLHSEYVVLSIVADPDGSLQFQIMTDDRHTPAWFDSVMFLTTDAGIPPNWTVRVGGGGVLDLAPAKWLIPGFWEAYFDDDPEAVQVFDYESNIIFASGAAPQA